MRRRAVLLALGALAGCTTPPAPALITRSAAGSPFARLRVDAAAPFDAWARHLDMSAMRGGPAVLAISGGGEDGAFGAGLLAGWRARGGRPRFDLVTGVSTGALMAPFAFLGEPRDDATLRRIYTTHPVGDILRPRGLPGLWADGLASSEPMRGLLRDYVDDETLGRVAARHRGGARLFVVTSNLDTGRAIVWNMGAIADEGLAPLFRDVLLASASIPGLFPPVRIALRAGDDALAEDHVDGGVNMQVLAVPEAAFGALDRPSRPGGAIYVLINNTLFPAPQAVPRAAVPIMQQTFTTMVRAQARGSIASARRFAARTGMDFAYAAIEPDVPVAYDPADRFALPYMRALHAYGEARARRGQAWRRE